MNYLKLTQSGTVVGKKSSEVWVNFANVNYFHRNDLTNNETVLRFVDDTAIGVHETVEQIVRWINPA